MLSKSEHHIVNMSEAVMAVKAALMQVVTVGMAVAMAVAKAMMILTVSDCHHVPVVGVVIPAKATTADNVAALQQSHEPVLPLQ